MKPIVKIIKKVLFLTEKHTFLPASRVHGVVQVPVAGELSSPEDHDRVNGGAGGGGVDVSEDDVDDEEERQNLLRKPDLLSSWKESL